MEQGAAYLGNAFLGSRVDVGLLRWLKQDWNSALRVSLTHIYIFIHNARKFRQKPTRGRSLQAYFWRQ